jgi:hypothetical protein
MNNFFKFYGFFLKNDVITIIKKISKCKNSIQLLLELKKKILNSYFPGINQFYFERIITLLIHEKFLINKTPLHLESEKKKEKINHLVSFLKIFFSLFHKNLFFSSNKYQKSLFKILLALKNKNFQLCNFKFILNCYFNRNPESNSILKIKDNLDIIKKILLTSSIEGIFLLFNFKNFKEFKSSPMLKKNFRIISLLRFCLKLICLKKSTNLLLFYSEKQRLYFSEENKMLRFKENFILNGDVIKIKKDSKVKNFEYFRRKFFLFLFWQNEWDLELFSYLKILKISKWILHKILCLHRNLLFQSKDSKGRTIFIRKPHSLFPFIRKLEILIQEFPYSIILKTRFLCQIILGNEFDKRVLKLRIWEKDVQNSHHFNLFFFLLLYSDLMLSGPKFENIFTSMIFLTNKNLLIVKDLFKTPQNFEKLLCSRFLKKNNFINLFFSFFIDTGLLDLGRKYILKLILYSKFEFQDMFLRYLLEGETEKLFFCLLTRTFNFQKILNGKNFDISKIFKILYQNGRWGLLYISIYETFQKKRVLDFDNEIKI